MKRQKDKQLMDEKVCEQEKAALAAIMQGLSKLDDIPTNPPNVQWFEQFVQIEMQQNRKKLMKDLTLFTIIALGILSVIMVSLYQMPQLFIGLQIVTTIFIAVYSGMSLFKKVRIDEK